MLNWSVVQKMLERSENQTIDRALPFVAPFQNRTIEMKEGSPMTRVDSMYYGLLVCVRTGQNRERSWQRCASNLERHTVCFKKLVKEVFEAH